MIFTFFFVIRTITATTIRILYLCLILCLSSNKTTQILRISVKHISIACSSYISICSSLVLFSHLILLKIYIYIYIHLFLFFNHKIFSVNRFRIYLMINFVQVLERSNNKDRVLLIKIFLTNPIFLGGKLQ